MVYNFSLMDGGGDFGMINIDPNAVIEPTPYENTDRMAELEAARLAQYGSTTEARAASDPMLNPTVRPAAPQADSNYIYYYSWIGGAATGEWRLYRAPNTQENQFKYGSRVFGGPTQATYTSAVGAGALLVQPQPIRDSNGNITGWTIPEGVTGTGVTGTGSGSGSTTGSSGFGATSTFGAGAGAGTGAGVGAGAGAGTDFSGTMTNPFAPGTDAAKAWNERKSAYDLLFQEFNRYGLGSLVQDIRSLVTEGTSPSEFAIRLRQTEGYKRRFAANQQRVAKGLSALNEAQYIALEDQYQDVMRRYGLPQSYYSRGEMGRQEGFEKFISQDVSPVELEDRIQTTYNRVINANPEVGIALRNFYPSITNGDILAYALDPDKALNEIKRKITAAEIGGAAVQAGLTTNESDAEYLARYGITREQAQQGYRTISGFLPRAQQLSSIYAKQVEGGPYTQASAEREVFGTPGAAEEERKRQRITSLEQAAFSGSSGLTGGALARERAGGF